MKKIPPILVIALCTAGIFSGITARRISKPPTQDRVSEKKTKEPSLPSTPSHAASPAIRSTDTIETLTGLPASGLYPRIALWLMDASEEEIAGYWNIYQKGRRDSDITNLIFLRWTRLNPQAAIAAAGSGEEHRAWWAWACHDPRASLAAAIAAGGNQVTSVALGIGEFHPEWLKRHIREIPGSARDYALEGVARWDDTENPLETLRFMKHNGGRTSSRNLELLARQDPWAAWNWAAQYDENDPFSDIPNARALILETLSRERSQDLKNIASGTSDVVMKRRVEAVIFGNLAKSDPDAALDQARSTTTPSLAASRFATLGQSMVESDPDRAFQLAEDLFTACPDAFYLGTTIEYPVGENQYSFHIPEVREFSESLMKKDPARFMEQIILLPAGEKDFERFSYLSDSWAGQDLPAYTDWVNRQTDEIARKRGATVISKHLQSEGHFEESADWALVNISDNSRPMIELITRWKHTDAEAPAKWLESAGPRLTEEQKSFIHTILNQPE